MKLRNLVIKIIFVLLFFLQVLCIYGKMKNKRNKVFVKFRFLESGILVCSDVMVRGVDILEVNWVIQYDSFKFVNFFVYRCGRIVRIGNLGNVLVFFFFAEDIYLNFLKINQKVELQRIDLCDSVNNYLLKLRKFVLKDRVLLEKGARVFVFFVQFYIKYECGFIFRIKDLDFGKFVNGYGFLRILKMLEVKGKDVFNFVFVEVDFSKIVYKYVNQFFFFEV